MKYPAQQFKKLCEVLTVITQHIDITNIHPAQVHYLAYQQLNEGQEHNKLGLVDNIITKAYKAEGMQFKPLFNNDNSFLLYPDGCNDNHCETAVKTALKTILNNHSN